MKRRARNEFVVFLQLCWFNLGSAYSLSRLKWSKIYFLVKQKVQRHCNAIIVMLEASSFRVTRCYFESKNLQMAAISRLHIIFLTFSKNWCSLGINTRMQYVEYWVYRISSFKVIRVKRFWFDSKKNYPNSLKDWCSLGINTTMQYVEYWVYRISGFEVIRVKRS